jgi:hypothetical protein
VLHWILFEDIELELEQSKKSFEAVIAALDCLSESSVHPNHRMSFKEFSDISEGASIGATAAEIAIHALGEHMHLNPEATHAALAGAAFLAVAAPSIYHKIAGKLKALKDKLFKTRPEDNTDKIVAPVEKDVMKGIAKLPKKEKSFITKAIDKLKSGQMNINKFVDELRSFTSELAGGTVMVSI